MVDLQAHVLPGADRGAADEQEALAMCRYAAEHGTRELVAAPKTDLSEPWDMEAADAALASLQTRLGDEIHLHRGCEVKLSEQNEKEVLADPGRFSINGRRYLLIDIGSEQLQRGGLTQFVDKLQELGSSPVIATPERKSRLRGSSGRLGHWVRRGAFVQVCGGSLTGLFGEKAQAAAIGLIDANLAHFVASDAHDLRNRTPDLLEVWDYIVYRWGESKAQELLIDNPWAALWGEKFESKRTRIRKKTSLRRMLFGKKRRSSGSRK